MPITQRWRGHIEAWQFSSVTQANYCRQHDINPRTFAARLSEYRQEREETKPALIPVMVTEDNMEPKPEARPLVLLLRQGHRLELPATVSAHWLSTLLRGLGWLVTPNTFGWQWRRWMCVAVSMAYQ